MTTPCSQFTTTSQASRRVVLALVCAVVACACNARDRDDALALTPAKAPPRNATPTDWSEAPLLVDDPPFDCKAVPVADTEAVNEFPVPKPPFTPGVFPCTRCHDKPDDFNATQRPLLAMHSDVRLVHGSREQWCYDCHSPSGRDQLRLAGGRLVSYEASYELCGQCHGEKLRDWRGGIHGRRVGCWNGHRQYLLCVNCHNPHEPKFKPRHPWPRPMRPDEIQPRSKS